MGKNSNLALYMHVIGQIKFTMIQFAVKFTRIKVNIFKRFIIWSCS